MNNVLNYTVNNSAQPLYINNPSAFVMRNGEHLYRMGDELPGVYVVNSGCVKTYRTTETGEEQITAFCMPGDLIGLDAMSDGISRSTALVLDTANITLISFTALLSKSKEFDFQSFIHKVGVALIRENDHSLMLSQRTADRRLAWFLLEFSDNLANRGLSPKEFTLPMTRTDIALFLGLAVETVCRELANLCESGLVKKNRRRIKLLNITQLRTIAIGDETSVNQSRAVMGGYAA